MQEHYATDLSSSRAKWLCRSLCARCVAVTCALYFHALDRCRWSSPSAGPRRPRARDHARDRLRQQRPLFFHHRPAEPVRRFRRVVARRFSISPPPYFGRSAIRVVLRCRRRCWRSSTSSDRPRRAETLRAVWFVVAAFVLMLTPAHYFCERVRLLLPLPRAAWLWCLSSTGHRRPRGCRRWAAARSRAFTHISVDRDARLRRGHVPRVMQLGARARAYRWRWPVAVPLAMLVQPVANPSPLAEHSTHYKVETSGGSSSASHIYWGYRVHRSVLSAADPTVRHEPQVSRYAAVVLPLESERPRASRDLRREACIQFLFARCRFPRHAGEPKCPTRAICW